MAQKWTARQGSVVYIGAPSIPMPEARVSVLRQVVSSVPEIAFAYVPQMYSQGQIDPARQVLYLVLQDSARGRVEQIMSRLTPALHAQLPQSDFIDAMPVFSDHPWLHDVIRTGCLLSVNDEELHRRCVEQAKASASGQERVE